ncbi:hypothetical protein CQ13_06115 [Bradyrhizobium retamae]|uniref:dUTPase-like domain-containing protein n=2 Tax=Bradyrhizobium retamae TaxID=1300035 RepID=A0A0R3MUS3_9BRAD|nr:hypothetical protein CQ13_06115 [Bradyrhizobium retamae]
MRLSEVEKANKDACITVFDPLAIERLHSFVQTSPIEVVTIGLDTIENSRAQHERVDNDAARRMSDQDFNKAREVITKCDVVLRGDATHVLDAVKAIGQILHCRGGVLVREQIEALMNAGALITHGESNSIRPASYDMRIGDQVWCQKSIETLSDTTPTFHLPPYSYAIVIAKEEARLPTFITGKFDLKVSMFLSGVILSNGPQIDPGYDGTLFCLLFNSNSQAVPLTRGEQFATIEFATTTRPATKYSQKYALAQRLEGVMQRNLSNPGGTIMAMIDSQMADIRSKLARLDGIFWGSIAVVNAVLISFAGAFCVFFLTIMWDRVKDAESRADKLKATVESVEGRGEKLTAASTEALAAIAEARAKALEEIEKARGTK